MRLEFGLLFFDWRFLNRESWRTFLAQNASIKGRALSFRVQIDFRIDLCLSNLLIVSCWFDTVLRNCANMVNTIDPSMIELCKLAANWVYLHFNLEQWPWFDVLGILFWFRRYLHSTIEDRLKECEHLTFRESILEEWFFRLLYRLIGPDLCRIHLFSRKWPSTDLHLLIFVCESRWEPNKICLNVRRRLHLLSNLA